MEAYGYVLQFVIKVGWVGLFAVVAWAIYFVIAEAFNAVKQGWITRSHIKAAFFMAADYVMYKVTRAKNAGRHAVKVKKDDVNIVVFWHELKTEFEALPYSLSRANNVHLPA